MEAWKDHQKTWPTPCTRDYKGINAPEGLTRKDGKSRMDQLPNAVAYGGTQTQQKWPTPLASCGSKTDSQAERNRNSPHMESAVKTAMNIPIEKKAQLNPSWVEWLMGWPIGWTDLKPLVTDKFRNVQPWHSTFSQKD